MSLCINPACPKPENSDDHLFCECCGAELLLNGHYQVLRLLGEGGCGKTYEVRDQDQGVKVLKILTRTEPKYVELFQREAEVLSQLRHPGIPQVESGACFMVFPQAGSPPLYCLVMEKVKGLDLRDYIRKRGRPVDAGLLVQWLIQLAQILQTVHNQNVLHRDIKPSNIMLKANGLLALIDFGTARSITNVYGAEVSLPPMTRVMSELFTPDEQMRGKPLPQSDFFALGRTAVYLLTAQNLTTFYNATTDEFHWRQAAPDVPEELADFLDRLMAPLAAQRPASADEILHELEQIAGGDPSPEPNSLAFEPTQLSMPTPAKSPNQPPKPTPPPRPARQAPPSPAPSALPESFVARCQTYLADYIGPIAAIVCKRTLSTDASRTPEAFVDALSRQIPDPEDAAKFRQRMS